mgnify:CR=1 FL=1
MEEVNTFSHVVYRNLIGLFATIVVEFIHINNFTPQLNIDHFEIYKIVGEKSKMYYVGTMPVAGDNYLEDYIVGSLCDYQYYICPVTLLNGTQNAFNVINVISTVDSTNDDIGAKKDPLRFNNQAVRIIGLKQDEENPNLFSIGSFEVKKYAVCIMIGAIIAFILALRWAKKIGINEDVFYVGFAWGLVIGVLGARIFYCVFDDFTYFIKPSDKVSQTKKI